MPTGLITSCSLAVLAGAAGATAQDDGPQRSWTLHAETLHTSAGDAIENALVVVEDGKIIAISPGVEAPRDAVTAKAITAGMIDASARVHTRFTSVEQSSEVTPTVDAEYGVDPFDPRWDRLARSGVTTAFVAPFNLNVVGGQGVTLKTAGPAPIAERELDGADLLCGAIGSQPSQRNSPAFGRPSSFYNRRPTTRMGVEWEWRRALFEAGQSPTDGDDPEIAALQAALGGRVGVFIQAWATQDIRTAVFLKEEMMREGFGEMRLVIDCGAEAWREPDMLVRTDTPVVLPPMPSQGRTSDRALMPMDTAKKLTDAGILVALSAHGADQPDERLAVQAGLAMRGGLSRAEALAAVTINPARILGIEDRVGTVEVGKDADLVLWNGEPFEITSRPVGVLVDGALVVDPR